MPDAGLLLGVEARKRAAISHVTSIAHLDKNNGGFIAHHQIDFAATKTAVTLNKHQPLTGKPVTSLLLGLSTSLCGLLCSSL